jgi:hypothetical protein
MDCVNHRLQVLDNLGFDQAWALVVIASSFCLSKKLKCLDPRLTRISAVLKPCRVQFGDKKLFLSQQIEF